MGASTACYRDSFTFHRKPTKKLARKGVKQDGAVAPSESFSITTAVVVSTSRNFIPPFVVCLRKIFRDYFIANVSEGSAGSENKSGLMTGDYSWSIL
jgi:hypothetical protein